MVSLEMLAQVRIPVHLNIDPDSRIEDSLPYVYDGTNSGEGIQGFNSGGRGVIFEHKGKTYKIKGVDPNAVLSKDVFKSKENRMIDVGAAIERVFLLESTGNKLSFTHSKPFSGLTASQIENSERSFKRLNNYWRSLNITPPLEFSRAVDMDIDFYGKETYQILFEMPEMISDFRVEEYSALLLEKLLYCPKEAFTDEGFIPLNRLYGRFKYWQGVNMNALLQSELDPTDASVVPQNYVFSRVDNGFGIFRVDHTSTVNDIMDPISELHKLENKNLFNQVTTGYYVMMYPFIVANGVKINNFKEAYQYSGNIRAPQYQVLVDTHMNVVKVGMSQTDLLAIEKERLTEVLNGHDAAVDFDQLKKKSEQRMKDATAYLNGGEERPHYSKIYDEHFI